MTGETIFQKMIDVVIDDLKNDILLYEKKVLEKNIISHSKSELRLFYAEELTSINDTLTRNNYNVQLDIEGFKSLLKRKIDFQIGESKVIEMLDSDQLILNELSQQFSKICNEVRQDLIDIALKLETDPSSFQIQKSYIHNRNEEIQKVIAFFVRDRVKKIKREQILKPLEESINDLTNIYSGINSRNNVQEKIKIVIELFRIFRENNLAFDRTHEIYWRYNLIEFFSENLVKETIFEILKKEVVLKQFEGRFGLGQILTSLDDRIKDKVRFEESVSRLIKADFIASVNGKLEWKGAGRKNIEPLVAFVKILEQNKIVGHFNTAKEAYLAYASLFQNLTGTPDYFSKYYNKPNENLQFEEQLTKLLFD